MNINKKTAKEDSPIVSLPTDDLDNPMLERWADASDIIIKDEDGNIII